MLLVKTRLAPSGIHGIGLVAAEVIPPGTEVWCFSADFDLQCSAEELAQLPVQMQEWFKLYGYLDYHLNRYIMCFDNARFINHSDDPNIRPDYSRNEYGVDVAVRNICVGEEITTDYSSFSISKRMLTQIFAADRIHILFCGLLSN